LTGSLFRGIIPEKYRYFSGNFRKIPPEISELTTLVTSLWGRKWRFPITLASGLYNSLYYRTSRDKR